MDALLAETSARTEITQTMISNFMSPVADYGEAVEMAPGTFTTNSNGVGLGQSKTYFRGFPDGDYDIDFDGIPFYDTNSLSHHSWAFFPSQFLGGIDFDRSPGTASTIGHAPFGGSINLLSKSFSPVQNIRGGFSYGSFNTRLFDGEYDSGSFGPSHKFNLNIDVHHLGSDGYQTYNFQTRNGGDIQVQYKVTDKTTITGYSGVIWLDANTPNFNATRCQMYGAGYQLHSAPAPRSLRRLRHQLLLTNNTDPLLYLNYQYNFYHVPTDFEYVGVHSELGKGWTFDIKPYTYNYDNSEKYSTPSPSPTTPLWSAPPTASRLGVNITVTASRRASSAIPAASTSTTATATTARRQQLSQVSRFGVFRAGMWYEWANTNRHQYPVRSSHQLDRRCVAELHGELRSRLLPALRRVRVPRHVEALHHTRRQVLLLHHRHQQFADDGKNRWPRLIQQPRASSLHRQRRQLLRHAPLGCRQLPHPEQLVRLRAVRYRAASFPRRQPSTSNRAPPAHAVATLPQQQKNTTYQTGTVLKLKHVTFDADYFHIHFDSGYSSFTPPDTGEPVYYLQPTLAHPGC